MVESVHLVEFLTTIWGLMSASLQRPLSKTFFPFLPEQHNFGHANNSNYTLVEHTSLTSVVKSWNYPSTIGCFTLFSLKFNFPCLWQQWHFELSLTKHYCFFALDLFQWIFTRSWKVMLLVILYKGREVIYMFKKSVTYTLKLFMAWSSFVWCKV